MSNTSFSRNSKHADVVIGQAREAEAETFAHAPGMTVAMAAGVAVLIAGGLAFAGWALVRLLAHV